MKKTFKIGEYAKGGIVSVETYGQSGVKLQCKDWDTNRVIFEVVTDEKREIYNTLLDWTSSYYTDKIYDWIELNVKQGVY